MLMQSMSRGNSVCFNLFFWIIAPIAWLPGPETWSRPIPEDQRDTPEHPATSASDLRAWIEELASDDYRVREHAADKLLQAGPAAEPFLREAAGSPLFERQLQAKRILEMVLEADIENRIEAFIHDVDGSRGISLPGWKRIQSRYKQDDKFRNVFVQLYQAEPGLYAAYEESLEAASSIFSKRIKSLYKCLRDGAAQQLQYHYYNPAVAIRSNVLALLLIGTDSGIAIDASNTALFDQMLAQIIPPGQSDKLLSSSMIKEWIGDWIIHRSSAGSLEYQHMLMGMRYETDKAILLAERVLKAERGDPQQQMYATLCVAQFGDQQHVTWIEPLLDRDNSVYSSVSRIDGKRIQRVIQLRDIALAALIHLTDQKYTDYGLMHLIERPPYFLVIQTIYFEKPTDREQALDKWRAWRRNHPQ